MEPRQTPAESLRQIVTDVASSYVASSSSGGRGIDLCRGEVCLQLAHLLAEASIEDADLGYQSPSGSELLRAAFLDAAERDGIALGTLGPQSIVTCSGGKQAMYLALHALVRPGMRILLPQPGWVPYTLWVRSLGAEPVYYNASDPLGGDLIDHLKSGAGDLVIVNTPNNPCGTELQVSAIEGIAKTAGDSGATVVADEVYRHFASDRSASFLPFVGKSDARVLVVDSISKWFGAAGLRIGFLVADEACSHLATTMRGVIDSCPSGPSQALALHLMTAPNCQIEQQVRHFVQRRLDGFQALLVAQGVPVSGRGGLYFWVRSQSSEMSLDAGEERTIRGVSGTLFGAPGFVRFCPTGLSRHDASTLGLESAAPEDDS